MAALANSDLLLCVRILHVLKLVSLEKSCAELVFSQSSGALGFIQLSGLIATCYDFSEVVICLTDFICFPRVAWISQILCAIFSETFDYFDPGSKLFFFPVFFLARLE